MSDKPVWEQDEYEPEPMTYLIDYDAHGKKTIKKARCGIYFGDDHQ